MHRTIVKNPQNMPPLTEAASQMGNQHLPDSAFIADQLYQLIDSILFQQVFRPLLLQRQSGIQERQTRTLSASDLGLPC
ncbi:Uncharacterised protein [Salmonella enterica subsp. enterica serovar Bovismorbificans]|uniref:Uncharacterized protein n=1 Tax=Salmonella enterica subsp. enterica serovar Bovismorbificans TaxID=58097 RepID=A0A655CHL0_SALET|nr:Uncharacterised protein [Salmonella enterica subsp. enterica serovar Bovismorbificans]